MGEGGPRRRERRPENLAPIDRYLDEGGRVVVWPSKATSKRAVLEYLAAKLDGADEYTEQELSRLLDRHHTFSDAALLRRELIERGLVQRTTDGSRYRLIHPRDVEGTGRHPGAGRKRC